MVYKTFICTPNPLYAMYARIVIVPVEIATPIAIRCTVSIDKHRKLGICYLQSINLKRRKGHRMCWALIVTTIVASHREGACGDSDHVLRMGRWVGYGHSQEKESFYSIHLKMLSIQWTFI